MTEHGYYNIDFSGDLPLINAKTSLADACIPQDRKDDIMLMHLRYKRKDLCDKLYDKTDCPSDDISIVHIGNGEFKWQRERVIGGDRCTLSNRFNWKTDDESILAGHAEALKGLPDVVTKE
jgi:hypothetical protein